MGQVEEHSPRIINADNLVGTVSGEDLTSGRRDDMDAAMTAYVDLKGRTAFGAGVVVPPIPTILASSHTYAPHAPVGNP